MCPLTGHAAVQLILKKFEYTQMPCCRLLFLILTYVIPCKELKLHKKYIQQNVYQYTVVRSKGGELGTCLGPPVFRGPLEVFRV